MLLQKPAFLLFYHARAAEASFGEWLGVLWHGLSLDCTVAGYVTAFPVLVVLASFWIPLSQRVWRIVLTVYFSLIALVTAAIFAVDLNLYGYWGFRLDGSVLIYLSDPGEALASASWGEVLRQILIMLVYAGAMIWSYRWILRLFRVVVQEHVRAEIDLADIRRGDRHATPEERRKTLFEELRGNRPGADAGTPRLLRSDRPNVVLILLESFGRTIMDETVNGEPVMPNMQRFKREGVWFENFFANSFRTDRGQVAVLCGFPAQTTMSIMKLPRKSATLPSLARSLGREGYRSVFMYGGDLNFTNQASFMYSSTTNKLSHTGDSRSRSIRRPICASEKAMAFNSLSSNFANGTSNGSWLERVSRPARNGCSSLPSASTSSPKRSTTTSSA